MQGWAAGKTPRHLAVDDIESLIWVLMWVILHQLEKCNALVPSTRRYLESWRSLDTVSAMSGRKILFVEELRLIPKEVHEKIYGPFVAYIPFLLKLFLITNAARWTVAIVTEDLEETEATNTWVSTGRVRWRRFARAYGFRSSKHASWRNLNLHAVRAILEVRGTQMGIASHQDGSGIVDARI